MVVWQGAPGWGENTRKRYDPKAPFNSPHAEEQWPPPVLIGLVTYATPLAKGLPEGEGLWPKCGGLRMVQNPVAAYGTSLPSATIRVYRAGGEQIGSLTSGDDGRWVYRLPVTFDDGELCVQASQARTGGAPSKLSEPRCAWVGPCPTGPPPEQLPDAAAPGLRWSDGGVWRYGTLAVQHEDGWKYGVLRKVGGS